MKTMMDKLFPKNKQEKRTITLPALLVLIPTSGLASFLLLKLADHALRILERALRTISEIGIDAAKQSPSDHPYVSQNIYDALFSVLSFSNEHKPFVALSFAAVAFVSALTIVKGKNALTKIISGVTYFTSILTSISVVSLGLELNILSRGMLVSNNSPMRRSTSAFPSLLHR